MATEKDMNELKCTITIDYKEVVHDIAEELLARLNIEEDGAYYRYVPNRILRSW